jgi:hypothetical protein
VGCANALRLDAPAHRRYCDQHRSPAARVARHRRMTTRMADRERRG